MKLGAWLLGRWWAACGWYCLRWGSRWYHQCFHCTYQQLTWWAWTRRRDNS